MRRLLRLAPLLAAFGGLAGTASAQTPSPRACDAARRSGHPLAGCAQPRPAASNPRATAVQPTPRGTARHTEGHRVISSELQTQLRDCNSGNASACWHAGQTRCRVDGYCQQPSLQLFIRACEGGAAVGCAAAAATYAVEHGAPADVPRSFQFYSRACDGGDAQGCLSAEGLVSLGQDGVPLDTARALQLASRARLLAESQCDQQSYESCALASGLFDRDGRGLPLDRGRAAQFLTRFHELVVQQCAGGSVLACHQASMAFESDPQRAAQFRARACQLDPTFYPSSVCTAARR